MSTGAYSENCYEDAVIETLKKVGWEYLHGPDIERDYRNPLCGEVLRYQLRRLNREVPDDAVDYAFARLHKIEGGSLAARNAVFTEYLQGGIEAPCRIGAGRNSRPRQCRASAAARAGRSRPEAGPS